MKWTRKPRLAALYSCWLQVVLQAAATGSNGEVVHGTVNGNIFLAMPARVVAEQVHTIEWVYVSSSTRRSIVQFISDKGNQVPHWFSGYRLRAQIYPNGTLSLRNVTLNDSGTYSCTVTAHSGEEFTQDTIVKVIGEVVIMDDLQIAPEDSNLTHVKGNKTNDYFMANCGFIGAFSGAGTLSIIAILTWAVVRYCRKRSRRQGKRTKGERSHKNGNHENEDVYEKMGRVPQ
ncbi:uncharacterized protein LOC144506060 [Mustelus asterias]